MEVTINVNERFAAIQHRGNQFPSPAGVVDITPVVPQMTPEQREAFSFSASAKPEELFYGFVARTLIDIERYRPFAERPASADDDSRVPSPEHFARLIRCSESFIAGLATHFSYRHGLDTAAIVQRAEQDVRS